MGISRPVGYGALSVVAIGLLWWSYGEPEKAVKPLAPKPQTVTTLEPDWVFPATETSLRFDKPTDKMRNIFKPLLSVDKAGLKIDQEELMKLPPNMAAGEADWTYTGMVEVNGVKLALLENATTHQGGYVKEGETWKKSRVLRITSASIVVVGPDGGEETVFRYNANLPPKPKAPPDGGFHPIDLGSSLNGVIGPKIEITSDAMPPQSAAGHTHTK